MPKTFATLFSGIGGTDLGLTNAGFKPVYAVEWNQGAIDILTANHDIPIVIHDDVNNINFGDLPDVDLLWASPVCCSYSGANHKKGETELDLKSSVSISNAAQFAQSVIIENVPTYYKSNAFRLLSEKLNQIGFSHYNNYRLNAANFGNPASRDRSYGVFSRSPFKLNLPPEDPIDWDKVLMQYRDYWVESELTDRQRTALDSFYGFGFDSSIENRPVAIERLGYYSNIPKYYISIGGYPCIKSHSHHDGRNPKPGYGKVGSYRSYMDFSYQCKSYSVTPQLLGVLNGFPINYSWGKNKAQSSAGCGNAVCPKMAEIISSCLFN